MTIRNDEPADLSQVPQLSETPTERDARMQWFRDAKFGMFIHWGPCSVGQREIGWGREAWRPWDIDAPQPSEDTRDAEYDRYYERFNPERFDADAWVRFAKASGMRYMVLVTKHHDGFSMFDTQLSDYSMMATPYAQDIVRPFLEACQRHGMKCGLYYSTRDWYHPDYLVGDNAAYDAWYMAQVEELLSNYGAVDMMWFDHVGGRDWAKWRFDALFEMMYRQQPELLVNNRAARFCGPATPEDQGPPSPEIERMAQGDFYTPEGVIGAMDVAADWESCIHCGKGWSYRGEDGFRGPEDCIKMLVSCCTGGGNLLLNFGPRPDGTFTDGESAVAEAMGAWLGRYGEAVYGTRGGPYNNGAWGGTCHKGDTVYLHVYRWADDSISFDALPRTVLAARTLDGKVASFTQTDDELTVRVAVADQDAPVTVVALTIDAPLDEGELVGLARMPEGDTSEYGNLASELDAPVLTRDASDVAPSLLLELPRRRNVKAVRIETPPELARPEGLRLLLRDEESQWDCVWESGAWDADQLIPITQFHAGIDVPGRNACAFKLEARGASPDVVSLTRLTVYAGRNRG